MDAWREPGSATFYASESQLRKQNQVQLARKIVNEPANYTTKPPHIPATYRPIHKTPVPLNCVEADTMFLQLYKPGMYKYAYVFVCQFTGGFITVPFPVQNGARHRIHICTVRHVAHGHICCSRPFDVCRARQRLEHV